MKKWTEKISQLYFTGFVSFLMITEFLSIEWAQGTFKTAGSATLMLMGMMLIFYLGGIGKITIKGVDKLLIIFLLFSTLSTILNFKYGWIDNIKSLVWMSIHYILLFHINLHFSDSPEEYCLVNRIMMFPVIIWNSTIIYAVYQLFNHIYYEVERLGQGFNNGRLYGIFRDPNYASLATSCILFLSLICYKKRKYRPLYLVSIILCMFYIMMCGSRGGWISFFIGAGIYCILKNGYIRGQFRLNRNRLILATIKAISLIICAFILRAGVLKIVEHTYSQDREIQIEVEDSKAATAYSEIEQTFQRTDLEGHSISNGRFDIWKSAILIGLDRPLIGLSPRNLNSYATCHYPDSYIGYTGQNAHSGYVGTLVGTGILGFGLMLIFFLLAAVKICPMSYADNSNFEIISAMIALVSTCMVGMFFIQDILIYNSISTVLFRTVLGNLKRMSDEKKE